MLMSLLTDAAWRLPFLAVEIVGLVLSLRALSRIPEAAKLAALAFGVMAVNSLAGLLVGIWRAFMFSEGHYSGMNTFATLLSAIGIARGLVDLAAWILLLVALHRAFQKPSASGQA
jgi:hypothetical protein